MQNNNSKLNTALLVVLIILAAICVWKLTDTDKEVLDDADFTQTSQLQTVDNEDKLDYTPPKEDPTPDPIVAKQCVKTGCYYAKCVSPEEAALMMSTCLTDAPPIMACYQNGECKIQADGECGWTETVEFNSCIDQYN